MTTKAATIEERIAEKKDSLKSLKISVGEHHFSGSVMAGPKDWDKNWEKGWNKDGH